MKPVLPTLLVTHRGYGRGLLEAAGAILGAIPEVDLIENEGLSPETLGDKVDAWLTAHSGPVIILTDLGFGSCCQTARLVSRNRPEVGILAGVNLPVLLALVQTREHPDPAALLMHLRERGRESVQIFREGRPA